MPANTLVRQLFLPVILILLGTLAGLGWFAQSSLHQFFLNHGKENLLARVKILRPQMVVLIHDLDSGKPGVSPQVACKHLGEDAEIHITLVSPKGDVLCDSKEDLSRLANQGNQSEIRQALDGPYGFAVRRDQFMASDTLFAAVPVQHQNKTLGVVRISLPMNQLGQSVDRLIWQLFLSVIIFGLALVMTLRYLSKRVMRHVAQVKSGAERLAEGDFSARLALTGVHEFDGLSQALNRMAAQLDDRIRTITEQRNEQEAILTSMVEGVFAVDPDETVIHLNQAAGRLFGTTPSTAQNRPLQAVVRNTKMLDFVKQALDSRDLLETDIDLIWEGQVRHLQTRGTVLRNIRNESIGAVFVLHDVTRLRRLETMRRDFVANVSHELKTPITSIKGFVETLQDGAMDSPEDAKRFLAIVSKQAERLNAIIEDLLSLSRIEQDSDTGEIVREECRLHEVLENAIGDCSPRAAQKEIKLSLECDRNLMKRVNPPLLEEAVANLVDNAIKYSDSNKTVQITANIEDEGVVIRVTDQGRGIDPEHLPRLFERFYRVDKARSRQMGGTGLGLAIVKHIAQAHGGKVDVTSRPGQGSVFSIYIP